MWAAIQGNRGNLSARAAQSGFSEWTGSDGTQVEPKECAKQELSWLPEEKNPTNNETIVCQVGREAHRPVKEKDSRVRIDWPDCPLGGRSRWSIDAGSWTWRMSSVAVPGGTWMAEATPSALAGNSFQVGAVCGGHWLWTPWSTGIMGMANQHEYGTLRNGVMA